MNGNLIAAMFFIIFVIILALPGFGGYLKQKQEHELKLACINAGKSLIESSCISGETK